MPQDILLKFCMEYKWDLSVEWYQNGKKFKTELGHSDLLKIYFNLSKIYLDPGILVHLNDLFSETAPPMVHKFHMQHDKVAGLQNDKMQAGWESKMATVPKNS